GRVCCPSSHPGVVLQQPICKLPGLDQDLRLRRLVQDLRFTCSGKCFLVTFPRRARRVPCLDKSTSSLLLRQILIDLISDLCCGRRRVLAVGLSVAREPLSVSN